MRGLGLLAIAVVVAGCRTGHGEPSPNWVATLGTLSDSEMEAIARGDDPVGGLQVLVTMNPEDYKGTAFYEELAKRNLTMKVNFMRNPGVLVALIQGQPGKEMAKADANAMISLAERLGHKASTRIKIDQVHGPDGKTPIVMADTWTVYETTSKEKLTGVATTMIFPTDEAARQAIRYVDSKAYACKVEPGAPNRKARVIAQVIAVRQGQHVGEWSAFQPLAKRFGGEVEYVTSSSESAGKN